MYIIRYQRKVTNSNNTYYQIEKHDKDWLVAKLIQVQAYMGELSITKDTDVKDFVKWYTTSTKNLPFSTIFKRYNSPQSYVAGMINNLLYGNQNDLTETQTVHLQFIINSYTDLSNEVNIMLQPNGDTDPVSFQENLWGTQ